MTLSYFDGHDEYVSFIRQVCASISDKIPATDLSSTLVAGRHKVDDETVVEDSVVDLYGGGPIELLNGDTVDTPLAPATIINNSETQTDNLEQADDTQAYHILVKDIRQIRESRC